MIYNRREKTVVIITLLTSVDKRLKFNPSVWQPAMSKWLKPHKFLVGAFWTMCVSLGKSPFAQRLSLPPARGNAPTKVLWGFSFGTDRTPPVSKSLHGLRGTEHRRVDNPRYSRPAFQRGTGEHVRYSGETERTWKESLAPATLEEASSAPLRARVNPVLHPWGCYALLIFH